MKQMVIRDIITDGRHQNIAAARRPLRPRPSDELRMADTRPQRINLLIQ